MQASNFSEKDITKELIEKVSKNARLNLTETEKHSLKKDFEQILKAFSEISSVADKTIKPTITPADSGFALREDIAEQSLTQEEALSNAKSTRGLIIGPKAM